MASRKKTGSSPRFDRDALERLAGVFRAFADATRLALLQELKAGPKSVGELVALLDTTQANISRHLKVLHAAGFLGRKRRGLQVFYSVSEPMVTEMCRVACDKLNRESRLKRRDVSFG